jgi:uroporphyrinogen III methyltransferase/synthase
VEVAGRPVLVARAAEARDVLPDALRERGAEVDVVALYETVAEQPEPAALEAAQAADYVTFTSSSTVRNLLDAVGDRFPRDARVVSIGPVTSQAAREAGLEVHVEAQRHDPSGLVAALIDDVRAGRQ